jgi:hypothetical protein
MKINLPGSHNPIDTAGQICYTSKQIGGGSPVTIDSEAAMNEARRKVLTGAAKELADLIKEIGTNDFGQWAGKLESIKADIEGVKDEEEEMLDNMSDNLKGGERGSRMQEVVSELEEALSIIDTTIDALNDVDWVTSLDDAMGKIEGAKD